MTGDLYDMAPLLPMLLVGALLALGPVAWVWFRQAGQPAQRRWRALTVLTLFLTFDLVVFGAFTRLTDSGLGCPDWPGCYGHSSPVGAAADIRAEETARPQGPVTRTKAWIEMVHRYFATGLGALISGTLVLSWGAWWAARRGRAAWADGAAPGWATAAFVWVCLQGAFGALTVTWKLYPAIVTAHLLGGLSGLALLTAQASAGARWTASGRGSGRGLRMAAWAVWGLLWVQCALGGWVSTNYAVLACSDFPTCDGRWWPPADFAQGFTLLRDLGHTADGQLLSFEALVAIHLAHRVGALVVLAGLVALGLGLRRADEADARRHGLALLLLAGLQFATGLSNVVLGWPLLAALAHTAGAAALVIVCTAVLARLPRAAGVATAV